MNGIDLAVVVMALLSMLVGVFRGFVRELLSLINWTVAVYVASIFYQKGASLISQWISNNNVRNAVAFAVIFVSTLFIGALIGILFIYLFKKTGLKSTDRSLGLVFGLARGVVLSIAGLLVLSYTSVASSKAWQQATAVAYAKPAMNWLGKRIQTEFSFSHKNAVHADMGIDIDPEDQRLVNLSQMEALALEEQQYND